MKTKIFATFAVIALFALTIAAYAYARSNNTTVAKTGCCKSADSCPMKAGMDHDKAEAHNGHCCQKHADGAVQPEGHASSCDCCGDSCPMKKGDGATAAVAGDGKSCCDSCDCCKDKAKDTAA